MSTEDRRQATDDLLTTIDEVVTGHERQQSFERPSLPGLDEPDLRQRLFGGQVRLEPALTPLGQRLDEGNDPRRGFAMFYDLDGRPCTLGRYTELSEGWSRQDSPIRVGLTVRRRATISTAWVGLSLSFGLPHNPPLIYETMVFGGRNDGFAMRHATRAQALREHELVCRFMCHTGGHRRVRFGEPPVPAKPAHRRKYSR